MAINEWKNALNWEKVPAAGPIHHLTPDELERYYYLPQTMSETLNQLSFGLADGYGLNCKQFIGPPGSGKTTFIYYLSKVLSERADIFNGFLFGVLHINRLAGRDDHEAVIRERVLKHLKDFFIANGLAERFEAVTAGDSPEKTKINRLEDIVVSEKHAFQKRLILVVDNVDETDSTEAEKDLRYFYGLLECEQIPKWLIVRDTTLSNYGKEFLTFVDTKFPQLVPFPKVDLHGILDKRIKADNPTGINPFSSELCARVLLPFNGDLRKAVTNVFAFLERTEPPKGNVAMEFLQEHLSNNFVEVMTAIQVYPNIYRNARSKLVPLERDVFLLISLYNRFPRDYVSTLTKWYIENYVRRSGHDSSRIFIDEGDVRRAIEFLIDVRLIERRDTDIYALTPRGESFVSFVSNPVYVRFCRKRCDDDGINMHPIFWNLARQNLFGIR